MAVARLAPLNVGVSVPLAVIGLPVHDTTAAASAAIATEVTVPALDDELVVSSVMLVMIPGSSQKLSTDKPGGRESGVACNPFERFVTEPGRLTVMDEAAPLLTICERRCWLPMTVPEKPETL